MPRNLEREAESWRQYAGELAEWALAHLVNRVDVWGAYKPPEWRQNADDKSYTAPAVDKRGQVFLDSQKLRRHFAGWRILGLHASDGTSSRWIAFDFDAHDGSEATRAANREGARGCVTRSAR